MTLTSQTMALVDYINGFYNNNNFLNINITLKNLNIDIKVIWIVKIKPFYYLPLGESILEKIWARSSVEDSGRFYRLIRVPSVPSKWQTPAFLFKSSIFYFMRVLGFFRQALNLKCGHRSCLLWDRQCTVRTSHLALHLGGATALYKQISGGADHEWGKLNG